MKKSHISGRNAHAKCITPDRHLLAMGESDVERRGEFQQRQ